MTYSRLSFSQIDKGVRNWVRTQGFPLNCTLRVHPYQCKLSGSCIMKNIFSVCITSIAHSPPTPPTRVILLRHDIALDGCNCRSSRDVFVSGAGGNVIFSIVLFSGCGHLFSTLKPRYSTDSAQKEHVSFFKREVYILKLG